MRMDAQNMRVETVDDAAEMFRRAMPIAGKREGVFVLPLGAGGEVLSKPQLVALGDGYGTTDVKLGDIFAVAYKTDAKTIIVAHNHPSGDLMPSKADRAFTAALAETCEKMGNIQLLDHLIVGGKGKFASLCESLKSKTR